MKYSKVPFRRVVFNHPSLKVPSGTNFKMLSLPKSNLKEQEKKKCNKMFLAYLVATLTLCYKLCSPHRGFLDKTIHRCNTYFPH